ncbi:hypothetical protein Q3G72_026869 [Acer saccharum]|nr:hypothetical protein Q3G72_026869 [Acer saccharum]
MSGGTKGDGGAMADELEEIDGWILDGLEDREEPHLGRTSTAIRLDQISVGDRSLSNNCRKLRFRGINGDQSRG